MGKLKIGLILGGLAAWYAMTGPSSEQLANKREYSLPEEITITETSLPHVVREKTDIHGNGTGYLEKIVKTSDIDFSKDFNIKTKRYNLVKKEEWLPSKIIGHIASLPTKLFFMDWDAGWGLDEEKSKAVLSMLEENKRISGLTVRINHNEAIYDCYRLFADDQVAERNNFAARLLLGLPTSIGGELFAELRRGDYYNPMNQTVVLFSNIESVSGHEIGHHEDYQRFDSDWEYALAGSIPSVKLYKEWQASQNAKELMSDDDQWQFNRYLLPAFGTYLFAAFYVSRKILQKSAMTSNGDKRDIDKVKDEEKPYINPLQTLRHISAMNLSLYAGIAAHNYSESLNSPEMLNYAAFGLGMLATAKITKEIMKHIVPYNHE